jgi:hypothetical protein
MKPANAEEAGSRTNWLQRQDCSLGKMRIIEANFISQSSHGTAPKQHGYRHSMANGQLHLLYQLNRQQRVATKIEEIIINANGVLS